MRTRSADEAVSVRAARQVTVSFVSFVLSNEDSKEWRKGGKEGRTDLTLHNRTFQRGIHGNFLYVTTQIRQDLQRQISQWSIRSLNRFSWVTVRHTQA